MKRSLVKLFAELRSLLRGWRALRTIEFNKYRVRPGSSERMIEERLLRSLPSQLQSTSSA
jgi:hypothetical protein